MVTESMDNMGTYEGKSCLIYLKFIWMKLRFRDNNL